MKSFTETLLLRVEKGHTILNFALILNLSYSSNSKTGYHCRIKENKDGGHSQFKSCKIDKKMKKKLVKKDATNRAS